MKKALGVLSIFALLAITLYAAHLRNEKIVCIQKTTGDWKEECL